MQVPGTDSDTLIGNLHCSLSHRGSKAQYLKTQGFGKQDCYLANTRSVRVGEASNFIRFFFPCKTTQAQCNHEKATQANTDAWKSETNPQEPTHPHPQLDFQPREPCDAITSVA